VGFADHKSAPTATQRVSRKVPRMQQPATERSAKKP